VDIDTKTLDGIKVVTLNGRLSMGPSLDRFNSTMNELLGHGHAKIVLNLEAVPSIDSSGLKPSKFTVQTLKMVGLLNLFSTFDDESQAVRSFH